jgi:pimeloyl-ACP methyl ester carboxylesterase
VSRRTYLPPGTAADAEAIIEAVTTEPAYVYGNSGGGSIGLELVTRRPDLVRTLVAHEAPLFQLLPDAEHFRQVLDQIATTHATAGVFAAMGVFGAAVEDGGPKYSEEMGQNEPTPEDQETMARMMGNFDLFIAHEVGPIGSYLPDLDALKEISTRVVSAAGEASGDQGPCRAAKVLAERLGIPVTYLPGGHGGWGSDPQDFADKLHEALTQP